jgi:hypothetical protein
VFWHFVSVALPVLAVAVCVLYVRRSRHRVLFVPRPSGGGGGSVGSGNAFVLIICAALAALGPGSAGITGYFSNTRQADTEKFNAHVALLDRAIDPKLPPPDRQEVLRFLAATESDPKTVQWANDELARVSVDVNALKKRAEDLAVKLAASQNDVASARLKTAEAEQKASAFSNLADKAIATAKEAIAHGEKMEKLNAEVASAKASQAVAEARFTKQATAEISASGGLYPAVGVFTGSDSILGVGGHYSALTSRWEPDNPFGVSVTSLLTHADPLGNIGGLTFTTPKPEIKFDPAAK